MWTLNKAFYEASASPEKMEEFQRQLEISELKAEMEQKLQALQSTYHTEAIQREVRHELTRVEHVNMIKDLREELKESREEVRKSREEVKELRSLMRLMMESHTQGTYQTNARFKTMCDSICKLASPRLPTRPVLESPLLHSPRAPLDEQ